MEWVIHPRITEIGDQWFASGFTDQIAGDKSRPRRASGENSVQVAPANDSTARYEGRDNPWSCLIREITQVIDKIFEALKSARWPLVINRSTLENRLPRIISGVCIRAACLTKDFSQALTNG